MTKVFGEGSPEWNEGKASQIAPSGTAARALAQTDFVGVAIHCATGGGICKNNPKATADPLPDEAGGYTGFQALFGAKYVNPAINGGSASVNDTNGAPIVDPFGQPGFPGFDGMTAKNTLGIVAQMQEHGVPVTFAYISDAHDNHGNSGNIHVAYGPGEAGYVQQLRDYDKAFGDFFTRLKNDGITKDNTLFVFTVEEGDHFAGTAPDAPCDGVTTPCTYANGHVTEVNGDLKRLVATYNASHGTSATTDFSVHADMAPNVYITGNPARDSATARNLEKAMSDMQVTNPLSGKMEHLFVAMADPVEEKLLHMVTADPARTPTFTPFAQGDYFLNASQATTMHEQQPGQLRLPAEHGRARPRRSPGTTAASSRRSRRRGSGSSGRASRRSSPAPACGRTTPTSARRCSRCRPEGQLRVRRPRPDRDPQGQRPAEVR